MIRVNLTIFHTKQGIDIKADIPANQDCTEGEEMALESIVKAIGNAELGGERVVLKGLFPYSQEQN